jgi:hypothetical protein
MKKKREPSLPMNVQLFSRPVISAYGFAPRVRRSKAWTS